MWRTTFYILSVLSVLVIGLLSLLHPPVLYALILVLPLIAL